MARLAKSKRKRISTIDRTFGIGVSTRKGDLGRFKKARVRKAAATKKGHRLTASRGGRGFGKGSQVRIGRSIRKRGGSWMGLRSATGSARRRKR